MSPLPHDFLLEMNALFGPDEAGALCRALEGAPCVSLRLNPGKPGAAPPADGAVPWCTEGRYLSGRPAFTFDPLLHAGCYYVQEASSMFIEQAYRQMDTPPRRLLDLCAAPGGKSTLWRSLMPAGTLLVANEPVRTRAQVLAENLSKWGQPDVVVTQALPERFAALPGFFDVVAADVPCSGEGMFRKDPASRDEWTAAAPARCAERQFRIVSDVWPALRQGGFLVYSTCTFNRQEDEDNVVRICEELGAEPVEVPADAAWGVVGDVTGQGLPVCRFLPHHARGEGFFLALLRKTAACPDAGNGRRKRRAGSGGIRTELRGAARWLCDEGEFQLVQTSPERVAAVRAALADDVARVAGAAGALSAGVPVAELRGRKAAPAHELALSPLLAPDAFPRAELDLPTALAYLRREAVTLPPDVPRGHVVATFGGHALGFLNQLGTRANNLYPAGWRIRKQTIE